MSKTSSQCFEEALKHRFIERLEEAMNGESSRSFAARCDLSDTVIRNYLNGKTFPSLDRLAKIAAASGLPMTWFITFDDENKNSEIKNKTSQLSSEDLDRKMMSIVSVMTDSEKIKAIQFFRRGGLCMVMPSIFVESESNNVDSKEISRSDSSDGRSDPAPTLSTQRTKDD